jgi:DNA invertase Pin-like site-specific DNA recombinase
MTDTLPVAVYLRMSTEHQQYSLDNQQATITAYAEKHGFTVVKGYTDGARSGLVLKRRNGLRQLLQDVMNRDAAFRAILVYDVSRWGRFQDADEAAHYEFVCKQAGVPVHYCAEPFVNDGSIQNMLMKALKRTMAGEYSRELGVKVLAGLKRLAMLGFKQGGLPGYGLRRMLLSADGKPKQLLAYGERKSLATERVILVPGPAEEVGVVRLIFRMFLDDGLAVHAIAVELNRQGISYRGSRWTHHTIQQILSHPKYTGCNAFGRTTQKLGTPSVRLPQSAWVLTPKAFESIVSEEAHQKAKNILLNRTIHKSDAELLESLRRLLITHGTLSLRLIKNSAETPSPSTYRKRFGSLRRAYQLIDFGKLPKFGSLDLRRRTQAIREDVLEKIQATSPEKFTIVRKSGRWRPHLRMKNGRFVTLLVARSLKADGLIWQIDPVLRECSWVTLLVLLNKNNTLIGEMRLFKRMFRNRRFNIKEGHPWLSSGAKIMTFPAFYESVLQVIASRR